jgi:small basic protein (TIGR04137 family)
MSVHKSLVSKMSMARERNVYKREERLAILKKEGRLKGETHVVGLPKTKVMKAMKKAKTEKKKEEGASSSPAKAAPAAAAAPAAKGGDKKAAAPAKK